MNFFHKFIVKHIGVLTKQESDGINIESQFQEESVEAVDANATYFENRLRSIRENLGIDATMVSHEPLTPVQNKEPETVELCSPIKNSPPKESKMNAERMEELKRRLNRLKQT